MASQKRAQLLEAAERLFDDNTPPGSTGSSLRRASWG